MTVFTEDRIDKIRPNDWLIFRFYANRQSQSVEAAGRLRSGLRIDFQLTNIWKGGVACLGRVGL